MAENKKQRRVLLVEPNYKNKYPPLGLMKLASYHRQRGDFVRFYKGEYRNLVVDLYAEEAVAKFCNIDPSVNWRNHKAKFCIFIQYGRKTALDGLLQLTKDFAPLLGNWLQYYWKKYRTGTITDSIAWDRICISTLFTFYYSITITTINQCKKLLRKGGDLLVGGVMATVIPDEIVKATEVTPIGGLLNRPGMLDKGSDVIIDELPPDYSILEEIEYKYPENNAYYGYMTRGCIRKCDFCAVPKLEPKYNNFIPLADKIKIINQEYGERKNLLLLDNNVLASKKFPLIIEEIKEAGFTVGATYTDPNYLDIAINNLKARKNPEAYRKLATNILKRFHKKLTGPTLVQFEQALMNNDVDWEVLPTQEQLFLLHDQFAELYESRRSKAPKKRWVDFNQGIDARLITEDKMALLASIPIRPLRIAFDSMQYADVYEKAIRLAKQYKIQHLSNYILFNFNDEPIELYQRLRLNVLLSEELDLQIYSFPMRYSPIWDDNGYHHNRKFVGEKWNKKFIRAVQCVLNATKGKVGRKRDFFEAAFGRNEEEYFEILWMPDSYILYREKSEELGYTQAWRTIFHALSVDDFNEILPALENNTISSLRENHSNLKQKIFLEHYQLSKDDVISKPDKMNLLVRNSYLYCNNNR